MRHKYLTAFLLALLLWIGGGWVLRTARGERVQGTTYYVRTDGGSPTQCTGLVNAPYPGSGTAQSCAWDHPFRALPPAGPPRIAGGDTLIIASGNYRMGYGAPEADLEDDACARDYTGGCYMPPIPSGPDPAHPTRLLGSGWDSGCLTPPQLWGTQRADLILNLTDAANIEVACLEITDHSSCVEFHTGGLTCERDTYPYGDWAAVGLYAEDSANVTLRNLNIHGLAAAGVHAGRLTDWTVEDVRIAANGLVGWDGDLWEGDDSNFGTLTFRRWTVEWNGCGETWPGGQPTGCWAQTAGGYGDGVGTGATGGDWIIEDSAFLHNTSDGLDLLYHSLGGRIVLDRVHAEGNAGNQIKVTGSTAITNSVLVGNCAFFDGQPFTYNVDPCRALGNTLEVVYTGGEQASMVNSTLYGQGDGLVGGGPREQGDCDGTETLVGRNNVFLGDADYFDPDDLTFLFYQEGCPGLTFNSDYSIYHRVKLSLYVPGSHDIAADPRLSGPFSGMAYGMALAAGSPAIDAGDNAFCPGTDIRGVPRPVDGDGNGVAVCDMGAYEWGVSLATPTPTTTGRPSPTATRTLLPATATATRTSADNPNPPGSAVKLAFVHHSVGDDWLGTYMGGLGDALGANNYYVSDTYYDWGPDEIGSYTDIGNWWDWFRGPRSATYTQALYNTTNLHAEFARPMADPGGENEVILFKSCYPNSHLGGHPAEPPTTGSNPLRGEDASSEAHTVGNAKGIYNDILQYFRTRQDKLFVVITAPPLVSAETDAAHAANARALNNWLVNEWLAGYAYGNVAVFDFYSVLTSNGGDRYTHDLGWASGNHHRWWQGAVQHVQTVANNFGAYGSEPGDSHPTAAGLQKATGEFVALLNVFYHRWKGGPAEPTPTATRTPQQATPTATRTYHPQPSATPRRTVTVYLPIILKGYWRPGGPAPTRSPTPSDSGCPAYGPGFRPVTDRDVYNAPTMPEPAPRQWFTDPTFGTCVVRVTDRTHDPAPGDPSTGMVNEYSRVQSFNADGTRLIARGIDGTWYLYDAQTLQPLGELPLEVEPRWDAVNPHLIYYSDETRLLSYNTQTEQQALVRDFRGDFPGQSLAAVWTRHEGRPSGDRRYWGLMAQDQDWETVAFVVYDRQADRVTIRDMRGVPGVGDGIDHVTISPLGTYFMASFDRDCAHGQLGNDGQPCGLMVYDRALANGRGLVRTIGHYDPTLDALGREVIVYQDNDTDHISMVDLATGTVTPLWEIDFSHTGIGLHFSGLAYNRPGWAVVSTHDEDAASHTWMDDQVFAIELRPGGRVVRLAHTQSITDESQPFEAHYWAEPHASTNADLTRVVFSSNWRRFDRAEVEMYMIALPWDWPERLETARRHPVRAASPPPFVASDEDATRGRDGR